ncbi:galactokinase [Klebsormidium nitens]|uniref:Galactokinase n=1 Tax=Klebsormidium nitens TaxID=105231 RepID=A0A1Y1I152_KLENI|nr:galactokinase [Klebsormidium nitens]|eukprot:GAQ83692.1 galactokinase [Klebsormidium nitens]
MGSRNGDLSGDAEVDNGSRASWPSASQLDELREAVAEAAGWLRQRIDIRVVAAPYRICPLGAHIDHQGGAVTAMALDTGILLGFVPSNSPEVRLTSRQFGGVVHFSVDDVPPQNDPSSSEEGRWGDYARGAVYALQQKGHVLKEGIIGIIDGSQGFDCSGVSSSAATGVAFLLALEYANGLYSITEEDNIELDRVIENEYLGLRNGVLDQSAILLSRKDRLTLIDCKTRQHRVVDPPSLRQPCSDSSLKPGYRILLAFSGLRQALTNTPGYNKRVDECQEAAATLLRAAGRADEKASLSNVSSEEYDMHREELNGAIARRAKHFFTETARVRRGVEAWEKGDLKLFGQLMTDSGRSSIENYECGSTPLIQMYQILISTPGVLGARFSGAGFRGCCIALVESQRAEAVTKQVRNGYSMVRPDLGKSAAFVLCESGDGAVVL